MQALLNLYNHSATWNLEANRVAINTFASRRSDGDAVAGLEELSLRDGVVHLHLKDPEEAVFAYLLSGLWASEDCFRVVAEGTVLGCHRARETDNLAAGPAAQSISPTTTRHSYA
jgi:hypothetical protein